MPCMSNPACRTREERLRLYPQDGLGGNSEQTAVVEPGRPLADSLLCGVMRARQ